MNSVDKVLTLLKQDSLVPEVDPYAISWKTEYDEHYIQLKNIACEDDRLAWFQSSEKDQYLLRLFDEGHSFNWTPITYNPYFGCECYLLEWIGDYLIFIYKEKHDTFICSIKDRQVQSVNFYGYELNRVGDIIFFFEEERANVKRVSLPTLVELDSISIQQASGENALPKIIIGDELKKV